jgi:hypothetical protein
MPSNDLTPLLQGLERMKARALDGALAGLKGAAAGVTLDMRSDPAHGDVTGATHANYTAFAVGRGADGSAEMAHAVAAVAALNPGHVATNSVTINAELGVIVTSVTDYQEKLETENAGQKAVLTPTIAASGTRFTQAAASGSKRALGG